MGVWGYLPSGHPCLVWKAFFRRRLGPDTAPCLPDRVWPPEVSQSGRRSSPSRIRLRSGCPRAGTRPAPSSANSPRAARQMEKGWRGGWWPAAASSTTLSETPASRALWSERQWSASLVTSSPTTMALNRSSPIWGLRCWPTPTLTSSLCFQGLNPTRPSEWQSIPSM